MNRKSGLTLIELLIIVAIIALLFASLTPIIKNAENTGKVNAENISDVVITNVARVFMTKPGEYAVLLRRGVELKLYQPHIDGIDLSTNAWLRIDKVRLYVDAKEGKYITFTKKPDADTGIAIIHVRSPEDVEGSGWMERVGKTFVERQTQVIE